MSFNMYFLLIDDKSLILNHCNLPVKLLFAVLQPFDLHTF